MSSLLFSLGVKPRQICRNFINLRQNSIFLDCSQKSYKWMQMFNTFKAHQYVPELAA